MTLYNEDCLVGMRRIGDRSVDFVFADLPYGTTRNPWDVVIPFEPLWSELHRVCKPHAAMVFTSMQPFASRLLLSNAVEFRYEIIWRKNKSTRFLDAKKRPLLAHENVLVFYREQPFYVPQMTRGHEPVHAYTKHTGDGSNYGKTRLGISGGGSTDRYPTTILDIPVVNNRKGGRIHPNQKPVELVEWFLNTFTKPGDMVLDPAAGSGTTLLAAHKLDRRCVAFESGAKEFAAAMTRLKAEGVL